MAVEISFRGLSCHNCNDTLKKYRGCDGNPIQPYLLDDKPLDKCPAKFIPSEVKDYIRYYNYYKKGFLPFRGGLLEQPIKLLQIFDVFESSENEIQKRKYEAM